MLDYRQKCHTILTVLITAFLLVSSQLAMAQGNSNGKANANGKNKNIGVGNASDGIQGSIITEKGIYYTGDPLEISLKFSRGSELITDGSVDAFVVIFAPVVSDDEASESDTDTLANVDALSDAVVLPVSDEASAEARKLFEVEAVDISALPVGTYQLGLILTNPGGDPLNINDWYTGLLGLIDIVGLTIADGAVDFDVDGDGQVDDDADGDGFSDTVVDNSTSGSDTGSDD